ncbi:MAG: hypothetical protein KBG62_06680 [Propionivibrio sp.]|mgnify:FL=1|nr:hypothetical protein [Propionivibrio sp.]
MGRSHQITKLTPEQQAKVSGMIRRYQYEHIDLIRDELAASGITVSCSTLYRHAQSLKNTDGGSSVIAGLTLVIVIDLNNGASTEIRTSACSSLVVSAVGALGLAGS